MVQKWVNILLYCPRGALTLPLLRAPFPLPLEGAQKRHEVPFLTENPTGVLNNYGE